MWKWQSLHCLSSISWRLFTAATVAMKIMHPRRLFMLERQLLRLKDNAWDNKVFYMDITYKICIVCLYYHRPRPHVDTALSCRGFRPFHLFNTFWIHIAASKFLSTNRPKKKYYARLRFGHGLTPVFLIPRGHLSFSKHVTSTFTARRTNT